MMEQAIENKALQGVDLAQVVEKTEQKNRANSVVTLLAPEEIPIPKLKESSYDDPVGAEYKRQRNNLVGSPEWKTDGAETIKLFHETLHSMGRHTFHW